ncbi:helix-turn-helix domain-containing protein [Streptomyces sp. NPDC006739]|uniref:helix-turn-helix domain-containing protein n=1 Tax=Streptomyces sp. NPDC006739 TaxID=3364763 RepID=UPI0036A1FE70
MAGCGESGRPRRQVPHRRSGSISTDTRALRVLSRLPDEGHPEFLYLSLHVRATAAIPGHGTEVSPAPGDLVFCDPDRPQGVRSDDDREVTVFRVSKRRLGVPDSDLRRLAGVLVRGDTGVGALVSVLLSALAAEEEFHGPRTGDRLAQGAVDMLAVLVMELLAEETRESGQTGETRETGRTATDASGAGTGLPARIRAFVDEHLMDPDLSPRSIAVAHHISVRHLHKLFESEGTTVSQWVRQRRLELCRHDLGRTSHRGLTVAAVARRWGFRSASHFSRVFRDTYGMSPKQWQACA